MKITKKLSGTKRPSWTFADQPVQRFLQPDVTTYIVGTWVYSGEGQGGGRPGEKGAGSGIPKVAGSGRRREKLCNIAQYFAIEKMQRGGSQKIQSGNRDYRVREAGGSNPPVPPDYTKIWEVFCPAPDSYV